MQNPIIRLLLLGRRRDGGLSAFVNGNTRLLVTLNGGASSGIFADKSGNGNNLTPAGGTFDAALGYEADGVNDHAETSGSIYTDDATPALTVTMRHMDMSANAHIAGEDGKAALTQSDALGNLSYSVTDSGGTEAATTTTPLLPGTDYTIVGYVDGSSNVQLRVYDSSGLYTSATSASALSGSATTSTTDFSIGAKVDGSAAYAGYLRQVLAANEAWDAAKADAIAAALQGTLGSETVTLSGWNVTTGGAYTFNPNSGDPHTGGVSLWLLDGSYYNGNNISASLGSGGTYPLTVYALDIATAAFVMPGSRLGGTLPSNINQLTQLRQLLFGNNFGLSGDLESLRGLTEMEFIIFNNSTIGGVLPAGLTKMLNFYAVTGAVTGFESGALQNAPFKLYQLQGNGLSQALVDAVINEIYAYRASYTDSSPELRIDGSNAAPSASVSSKITDLENNYGWTITTS